MKETLFSYAKQNCIKTEHILPQRATTEDKGLRLRLVSGNPAPFQLSFSHLPSRSSASDSLNCSVTEQISSIFSYLEQNGERGRIEEKIQGPRNREAKSLACSVGFQSFTTNCQATGQ